MTQYQPIGRLRIPPGFWTELLTWQLAPPPPGYGESARRRFRAALARAEAPAGKDVYLWLDTADAEYVCAVLESQLARWRTPRQGSRYQRTARRLRRMLEILLVQAVEVG